MAPLASFDGLAIVKPSAVLIKLDYLPIFPTPLSVILLIIHVKSYSLYCVRGHTLPRSLGDHGKVCPLLYMYFLFFRIRVVNSFI